MNQQPRDRAKDRDFVPEPLIDAGGHDRRFRGLFAGVPVIVLLVSVAVLLLLLVLHDRFMQRVDECRQIYRSDPTVAILEEEAPYFLQPFGGLTSYLSSVDEPSVVLSRFRGLHAAAMRDHVERGDFRGRPLGDLTIDVAPAARGGSEIWIVCP
jgi:hypothetical protein